MLFGYELKKIWRRVSPLLVLVVLLATAVTTTVITAVVFNNAPDVIPEVSAEYAVLAHKINQWNSGINHDEFTDAFDDFYEAYKEMNASTFDGDQVLVQSYKTAKECFDTFYTEYYCKYFATSFENNITDYLLVQSKYIDSFDEIMDGLYTYFITSDYDDPDDIVDGLESTTDWDDASLQTILSNLFYPQKISDADLEDLQGFFTDHPAGAADYNVNDAYTYAINRFWVAVATEMSSIYTGSLSQYEGFSDFQDVVTSTRAYQLAAHRLAHPTEEFAKPFVFGSIFNGTDQVSLFDFIFTNMEMAMIPVALLVMIWAASVFFTDNYQKTLITPVATGHKRSTIILAKMAVVLSLTAAALLLLVAVYVVGGLLLFQAYIGPDILFLFNGTTVMTMSPINYFAIYFLNLVFKLLPLIAVCGLFSFTKTQPFVIIGFTALICVLVFVANALLGGFWFYQFVPLMGLDPLRYFGAELLLAPMPSAYNLWYTLPAVLVLDVILYWALIHKFKRHDF